MGGGETASTEDWGDGSCHRCRIFPLQVGCYEVEEQVPPRSLQREARPNSSRLSSARLGSACRPLGGTAGSRTAPRRRRLLHLRRCRVRPPGAAAPRVSPVPGSPLLTSRLMRGTAGGNGAQIILKERRKITMGNRHEAGFVSPLLQ